MMEQQQSRHEEVEQLEAEVSDLRAKIDALEERDAEREEELANVSLSMCFDLTNSLMRKRCSTMYGWKVCCVDVDGDKYEAVLLKDFVEGNHFGVWHLLFQAAVTVGYVSSINAFQLNETLLTFFVGASWLL